MIYKIITKKLYYPFGNISITFILCKVNREIIKECVKLDFLAEVGDIKRFSSFNKFYAYTGLEPRRFETGD